MLMDELLQVMAGQTVAAATPTLSESVDLASDQWPAGRDIGEGNIWYFLAVAPAAAAVTIELVTSATADLATPTVHLAHTSTVAAGDHILLPVVFPRRTPLAGGVPEDAVSVFRYVGVRVTDAVGGEWAVYGLEAGPALSPIVYPASTSS